MSDLLVLRFLHLLGFAYWLGADLGVFYSSYYVVNEKLSPEVRTATAKILFALDQVPRICMTMTLPLGVHLAWRFSALPITSGTVTLIWLTCFAWLAMVITLHVAKPSPARAILTRFDFWFRLTMAAALFGIGVAALAGAWQTPPYVAWKLAIFGGLVACGLIVRIKLKDFGPAFAAIAAGKVSDDANAAIRRTLGGTRPFVIMIWIGLLLSAALGIHLI